MCCQNKYFNVDQTTPESEIHVEVIQKPNTQTVLDWDHFNWYAHFKNNICFPKDEFRKSQKWFC